MNNPRLHAMWLITKRELKSALYGLGIYVVLAAIFFLVAYFGIHRSLIEVANNGLLVLPNPINQPFFITVSLAAVYLGLSSAVAISRERDQGTIEVLFYGPVDGIAYVAAKYLQQMLAFAVILVFALINFSLVSAVTNLGFGSDLFGIIVLAVFLASCTISFGIFLSTITRRMIVSIVLFLGLALFFIGFWVAFKIVLTIRGRELTEVMAYVRMIMDAVNVVLAWISPVSYFERGSAALGMGNMGGLLSSVLSSLAYSGSLLGLSVLFFNRKGVKR